MDKLAATRSGKVWAVTHHAGSVSLYRARTEASAYRKALLDYGRNGCPYRATTDLDEVEFAYSVGAIINE